MESKSQSSWLKYYPLTLTQPFSKGEKIVKIWKKIKKTEPLYKSMKKAFMLSQPLHSVDRSWRQTAIA